MKQEPKISVIIPAFNSAEHISNIINSVKSQSFAAFECIIINDGSVDNTGDVVRELTAEDDRFTVVDQENQGVGAARNKGISMAVGNYIVFYDADDTVPSGSLSSLYRTALKKDADLVIGRMLYANLGESHFTKAVERLSMKEVIHPFDRDLARSSSVCNKMFRRSVIIDNDIYFTKLRRYEDFVFSLQFESKCKIITGCDDVVYTYERRPYWEEASAMMHNDMSMFDDMQTSMNICLGTVDEHYHSRRLSMADADLIELKELDVMYERFVSGLYCRFVRTNFIDEIYRFAWLADEEVIERIREIIPQYHKHIFPMDWLTDVLNRSEDIPFENDNVVSIEELEKRPTVTFAVSGPVDPVKLNNVVKGIYNQNNPLFEIFIQTDLYELLNPEIKNLRNLFTVEAEGSEFKKCVLEKSRGRYMWFIDDILYLSRTSLKGMMDAIEAGSNYLFVSAPLIHKSEDGYSRIRANATSFIPEFAKRRLRTEYNQLDYLWINKLFSVAKLKSMKDPFGQGDWETLDRFYVRSNYKKINNLTLLTELTDEEVLKKVRSNSVLKTWESKLKEEEEFQKSLILREKKERIGAEKRKAERFGLWKRFFRWVTIKIIYPFAYLIFKMKSVEKGKVIFVEPTQLEPTNSMKGMIRAVKAAGYSNILQMSLAHNKVRRKKQLARELAFIKEFATAEYVFTTEALSTVGGFTKRKETTLVQLWHGCGAFKKFGFSTAELKFGGNLQEKLKYPDYRNLDLITVSSPDVIWAYEEAMNYKDDGVVQATGISRTDIFYDEKYVEEARQRVLDLVPEAKGKKIILYAPTFRGRVRRAKAPNRLDISALHKALGEEYFLLIKHHPHVKVRPLVPAECSGFARDVTTSATIDDLLCCTDICISDYSSLVFEYSLFGKPMIFFAYDLDEYNDWRGFYYDYDQLTPGPVVMSNDEIIRYIKSIDTEFDKKAVEEFRQKFMSSCDGHATERILKKIGILS